MDSFISWVGGKKLLRNKILSLFPEKEGFNRYVEVFGFCFRQTDMQKQKSTTIWMEDL